MQENIWLSVSLFCSENKRSYILNKGIIPFLDKLSTENKRPSFLIGFNHSAGENIRFSISTPESRADHLAGEIDAYFKKIFSGSVAVEKEDLLPGVVTELFMPFAENTIQYGLYRPVKDNENENAIRLKMAMSAIILNALKEEDMNDNGINTFAFYLVFVLLNVIGKSAHMSEKEIIDLYKNADDEKIDDIIHSEFIKNKEGLIEIAHAIIYKEHTEEWLSSWELSLKKIVGEAADTKDILQIHELLIFLIFKQLDITGQRKIMLYYFIDQLMMTDLKNEIFKGP